MELGITALPPKKKWCGFEGWHAWLNWRHLQESKVIIHFCNMWCTVAFQDEHDQTLPCSKDVWDCPDFPASPHCWVLLLPISCKKTKKQKEWCLQNAQGREKGFNHIQLSTGKVWEDVMRIEVFDCQLCKCIHMTVLWLSDRLWSE